MDYLFETSIEEKIKLLGDGEYINCFLVEQRNLVPRNLQGNKSI